MEGDIGLEEGGEFGGDEVVVVISGDQDKSSNGDGGEGFDGIEKIGSGSYSFSKYLRVEPPPRSGLNRSTTEQESLRSRKKVVAPGLEKGKDESFSLRQRPPTQSAYSKPKSRLVEPPVPSNWKLADDKVKTDTVGSAVPSSASFSNNSPSRYAIATTPKENRRGAGTTPKTSAPVTPRTPLMASPREEEDVEEVYFSGLVKGNRTKRPAKKIKPLFLIELSAFVCIMLFLISSLTVNDLKDSKIWSLQLWKWCVLVLVIFCGRLVSEWFTDTMVFLIERNFLLKRKVLYFVYSLQKSVKIFIWLGLVLLTWSLLINRGVRRSKDTARVLNHITRALVSALVAAGSWILKTLFIKILASSFHVKRFFDRIQESIFHQYVLQTLSGPPLMEYAEKIGSSRVSGQLSFTSSKRGRLVKEEETIDVQKLYKMRREKVSAWTMGGLVKIIRNSGLSTLSDTLDDSKSVEDERGEEKEKNITSEWEAKAAAYRIFSNVAKHGHKHIDEEDLLRFLNKDEADNVLPLFEGVVETRMIRRKAFVNWVVNVYNERKFLAHSLNDTKTAIEELNKLVSGILLIVLTIVWLLLMGFATTQVLVFISSQVLLVVFMFGNTCKTIFEAVINVFIMHPFDVGDRCVIDGVQVVVEEMNILTTIFLRYDNEKIFYPNAVLATKPISNFNRSPEMKDSVEFDVDVSTSIESITALKAKIKAYIESKPQHWRPNHSMRVREIEDVNKMKMSLYVTHTMNFQNYEEKSERRSNLVFELKRIFEELGIKYHLLPQEVLIRYVGSASPPATIATRL